MKIRQAFFKENISEKEIVKRNKAQLKKLKELRKRIDDMIYILEKMEE